MAKDVLDRIVAHEWEMFSAVNEGQEKAACQERPVEFDHMRRAQFEAWSDEACESYLADLEAAAAEGRNLANEKYLHMMRKTDPQGYARLANGLEAPQGRKAELVDTLVARMVSDTNALNEQYPYFSIFMRPATGDGDNDYDTSLETYIHGEFSTYSEATLEALAHHAGALAAKGSSLARATLESTLRHQGFASLEEAEEEARDQVQVIGAMRSCPDCCD